MQTTIFLSSANFQKNVKSKLHHIENSKTHNEPPHQHLCCLQNQLFSSVVLKELIKFRSGGRAHGRRRIMPMVTPPPCSVTSLTWVTTRHQRGFYSKTVGTHIFNLEWYHALYFAITFRPVMYCICSHLYTTLTQTFFLKLMFGQAYRL